MNVFSWFVSLAHNDFLFLFSSSWMHAFNELKLCELRPNVTNRRSGGEEKELFLDFDTQNGNLIKVNDTKHGQMNVLLGMEYRQCRGDRARTTKHVSACDGRSDVRSSLLFYFCHILPQNSKSAAFVLFCLPLVRKTMTKVQSGRRRSLDSIIHCSFSRVFFFKGTRIPSYLVFIEMLSVFWFLVSVFVCIICRIIAHILFSILAHSKTKPDEFDRIARILLFKTIKMCIRASYTFIRCVGRMRSAADKVVSYYFMEQHNSKIHAFSLFRWRSKNTFHLIWENVIISNRFLFLFLLHWRTGIARMCLFLAYSVLSGSIVYQSNQFYYVTNA